MGLRIKERHVAVLGELLTHGAHGAPAVLMVGRGLPLTELESHGLAEQVTDPTRILSDRWRLTTAGTTFARFLTEGTTAA